MVSKSGGWNLGRYFFASLLFLVFMPTVFGQFSVDIVGGKAVLRPEVKEGETTIIERSITIINNNDFAINARLEPSKELEDVIEIIDEEIEIEANSEKEARYNVVLTDKYSYSGNINVFFSDVDGQAGVVLSAVLDIIGENGLKESDDEADVELNFGSTQQEEDNVDANEDDLTLEKEDANKDEAKVITQTKLPIIIFVSLIVLALGAAGFIFLLKK